jgi:hypothetical protein
MQTFAFQTGNYSAALTTEGFRFITQKNEFGFINAFFAVHDFSSYSTSRNKVNSSKTESYFN